MPTKDEATAAIRKAGTAKKKWLNDVRRKVGNYGGAVVAVLILLIDWRFSAPKKAELQSIDTVVTSPAYAAIATPQVVYVRDGLVIPVGLTWGAQVAIPGEVCFWGDSDAAGLVMETSQDGGKTWGSHRRFNRARFRAPVNTTIRFTVQDPPPPGETCKRRY